MEAIFETTLAKALLVAQGNFSPIVKDTEAFKYKYAPLDKVLECVRPALTDAGILITQPSRVWRNGDSEYCEQKTILIHVESGQQIESSMVMQCDTGPQDRGSEVTYLRRYTLLNVLGIFPVDEDDDGSSASKGAKLNPKLSQSNASKKIKQASHPKINNSVVPQEKLPAIATTYRVFLKTATDQKSLRDWWERNKKELDKLKKESDEAWTIVVNEFANRKKELEK